jgi:hypothetical protein
LFLGGANFQSVVKRSTAQLFAWAKSLTSFLFALNKARFATNRTSRAKLKNLGRSLRLTLRISNAILHGITFATFDRGDGPRVGHLTIFLHSPQTSRTS